VLLPLIPFVELVPFNVESLPAPCVAPPSPVPIVVFGAAISVLPAPALASRSSPQLLKVQIIPAIKKTFLIIYRFIVDNLTIVVHSSTMLPEPFAIDRQEQRNRLPLFLPGNQFLNAMLPVIPKRKWLFTLREANLSFAVSIVNR
jgi:hypothetical protein